MDLPVALAALAALSQDARLRAFRALVQAGHGGLRVGELRERLQVPAATLSAHLNVLRRAGLVEDQRHGRQIQVRAGFAQMDALLAFLTENCCAGSGECAPSPICRPAAPTATANSKEVSMPSPLRVLFVCVENSNRSQIAEAFARTLGGNAVEALSAGSRPSGRINPKALRFMAELGIDLAGQHSKSLHDIGGEFAAVITMGCGDQCPWVPARLREDWALPDPRDLDDDGYRAVRDQIGARVQSLLDRLR